MKKKNLLFFILLAFGSSNLFSQQYIWMRKANVGGGPRYAAYSFSVGNYGYIGSGVEFSGGTTSYTKTDFWEYDVSNDTWTQKANSPGGICRSAATGFSIGNKGYVCLGWTPTAVQDLWEYDPSTNIWTQKANFGGSARYTAADFVIDSLAYIGSGYAPVSKDFWCYNPSTDAWTQIADYGGTARQSSSGFELNGFGYVFGGAEQFIAQYNDLWKYNPVSNSWLQVSSMPAPGRNAAIAFSLNGAAFVGTGGDDNQAYQDFWKYDPLTDSWQAITDFAGGTRITGQSFVVNNRAYIGTGSTNIYPNLNNKDDLWELIYTDACIITGKLFYDLNNNGVEDVGEPPIKNKLVTETVSGNIAFSGLDGSYSLAVLDTGNYVITTDSAGYYSPVPASKNVYFSTINTTDSLHDFAFQATTAINDLAVSISPYSAFRPGFSAWYNVSYENLGTLIQSPVITMVLDSNLTYVSSAVTPTSVSGDTIIWNLPPLFPFQNGSFNVEVLVDVSTPIGTVVASHAQIEPFTADVNIYNNYSSWTDTITGSFDPNDIAVNLAEITTTQLPSQPWLEYLIRFQNTGTDTAFTVDVVNEVPQGVDLNSMELIATSHPVQVRYVQQYNTFGFKFSNILLADSNTNEPASHGFIRYRIKPQTGLAVGYHINNSANIYFDFNAPVATNTATTTIVSPTAVTSLQVKTDFSITPSLVTDKFYVTAKTKNTYTLKLYNAKGKVLMTNAHTGNSYVSIKHLPRGIYFVELVTGGNTHVEKIVKD
jgi:N-acetylneuraminic acid mutarotase